MSYAGIERESNSQEAYQRGLAAGRELGRQEAQRDALLTVSSLVALAGGEVRIPRNLLESQNPTMISRINDLETNEVVLKIE